MLILASTSLFRKELLVRLGIPFVCENPVTDEAPQPHEAPCDTAIRLARAKAQSVIEKYPHDLIIGSDQVAVCKNIRYNKPGDRDTAIKHLKELSGQTITFYTALCLFNSNTKQLEEDVVTCRVHMRAFESEEITRYVDREDVLQCAGAARFEGLGISLTEKIEADDPTALMGLPLISLSRILRAHHLLVP